MIAMSPNCTVANRFESNILPDHFVVGHDSDQPEACPHAELYVFCRPYEEAASCCHTRSSGLAGQLPTASAVGITTVDHHCREQPGWLSARNGGHAIFSRADVYHWQQHQPERARPLSQPQQRGRWGGAGGDGIPAGARCRCWSSVRIFTSGWSR